MILESVTIKIAPDKTITIEATGEPMPDMPEFAYDISIDISNNTYTTTLVDMSEVNILPSEEGEPEKNLGNIKNQQYSLVPLAISPGTYQATIRVQTLDPVYIVLAQTTNYLKWTVSSNGSVQWNAYTDGCLGYTTPITHWYVSACSSSAPYYSGGVAYNAASGTYYNWDWGNPNLSTNAYHSITVGGKNDGHCTYSWSHSDWGEDANLTWGRRIVVQCP